MQSAPCLVNTPSTERIAKFLGRDNGSRSEYLSRTVARGSLWIIARPSHWPRSLLPRIYSLLFSSASLCISSRDRSRNLRRHCFLFFFAPFPLFQWFASLCEGSVGRELIREFVYHRMKEYLLANVEVKPKGIFISWLRTVVTDLSSGLSIFVWLDGIFGIVKNFSDE